jgi:hypothetical protein
VFRMLASAALAARAMGIGDFEAAERHLTEALERARGSVPYADVLCSSHRLWLAFQRGEPLGSGADLVQRDASLTSGVGMEAPPAVLRVLALVVTDDAAARCGLHEIARVGFEDLERDEHWMVTMALLALVVARAGDPAHAEALYTKLLPVRHLMVSHDLMRSVAGSVELPLGVLALARGRPVDAVTHFEAAQERERAMGLRPALVRSGLALARALDRRGEPGDAEQASRARAEAQAEGARLGVNLREWLEQHA